MAKKSVPVMTRLPPELHSTLKRLAKKEERSLNAQMITLLKEALMTRGEPPIAKQKARKS